MAFNLKRVQDQYPSDWDITTFRDITKGTQLGTPSRGESPDDNIPLLKMGNLTWGGLNIQECELLSRDSVEDTLYLEDGDFLFNTRNTPELVGKSAVWHCELANAVCDNNINRIKFKNKANQDFICSQLTFGPGKGRVRSLSAGSTSVAAIYWKDLAKLKVALPPLPEQKKIARILSTWDKAIETVDKLIENSQQQKKALMQQLLTGKKRLPGFSGEWKTTHLEEIANTYSGGTPSRSKPQYYGGEIPWIKSGEVNSRYIISTEEFITSEGLKNSSAKMVQEDSILLALYGATAGVIGISKINAAINQAILCILPNDEIDTMFLYYYLEMYMEKAKRLVQGGQPNLNAGIIRKIEVNLPRPDEQKAIARLIICADHTTIKHTETRAVFDEAKKALMQQLLTGKRRVQVDDDRSLAHAG
ncbi:MAG: restriction endonuclease subunit S [Desulfomicrobium sp.]